VQEIVIEGFGRGENIEPVLAIALGLRRCAPGPIDRFPPTLFRGAENDDALDRIRAESRSQRIEGPCLHSLHPDRRRCSAIGGHRSAAIRTKRNNLCGEGGFEIVDDDARLVGDIELVVANVLNSVADEERRREKQNERDHDEGERKPSPGRQVG
jgi:hypothetical protein